jgi:hypothetical protein
MEDVEMSGKEPVFEAVGGLSEEALRALARLLLDIARKRRRAAKLAAESTTAANAPSGDTRPAAL